MPSLRNRRVLRDGEPLLDCGWDDDDDVYDNVDDDEHLAGDNCNDKDYEDDYRILVQWSCSCSQGLL